MEHESFDPLERELKQALERRPAPPGLKTRIMAARRERQQESRRWHSVLWMRVAASLLIVAILGGVVRWDYQRIQERRRGEEARQQVLTALRITSHALNQVHARLTAHDRGE